MNQLIVRRLDAAVVRALRTRAARHGRSAEAEHREILRGALLGTKTSSGLKDMLLAMPGAGRDQDFRRVKDRGRRVAF